jgi:hypothetical protein
MTKREERALNARLKLIALIEEERRGLQRLPLITGIKFQIDYGTPPRSRKRRAREPHRCN